MRILLFTGKGGVGKTTVAAATALRAAAAGHRTVICSTDGAHSLADAFAVPLGDAPAPIAERLWGAQLDARGRLEAAWSDVRDYLVALFDWAGAAPIEAEELAVVPGLDEVLALAEIRELADCGDYDVVVVDCAPTAETLRLLALPDVLGWYMQRVFPAQRHATRVMRPLLSRLVSMPVAGDGVFDALRRFHERLAAARDLLTDGTVTSARLVVNPERLVVAEARRTFTYLSLFGYHVDAVVVNRLLPATVTDPWFATWKEVQAAHVDGIAAAFAGLPLLPAPLAPHELVGPVQLGDFGSALYGDRDPVAILAEPSGFRVDAVGGALVLSLPLPLATRDDVELGRHDDGELLLAVGSYRRALLLPDSLRRREVASARLAGDRLEVEFVEVPT